jgi:2'-5' RNA ligase
MKIRFGLYFIPPEGRFYQQGSAVVGYDIRNQQPVAPPEGIDPSWQSSNVQFGFHVSITDAIITDEQKLPEIINHTEELLRSLKPENRYLLTKQRLGFWRDSSTMAVMVMEANRNIEILHDVLVTALHPMGSGTEYTEKNIKFDTDAANQKTKLFYSPYIFEDFVPHFTCVAAYTGPTDGRAAVESRLEQLFAGINKVEFSTIAFVVQREGEPYFHIEQEFNLHGEQSDSETE